MKPVREVSTHASGRLTPPALVLVLLTSIYTFNFVDRQILSILVEPIKRDLLLSDTQIGLVSGIFFALFYTTLGIPLAWISDRTIRIRVIAAACTVWSLFSMSCGFANGFVALALARIGVGAGEAGGTPPAHSLLSDYFPRERRGTALAVYSIGVPLGMMLAAMIGGGVAARFGWRAAFFFTGAPGLILALLALFLIKEPPRGRLDADSDGLSRSSMANGLKLFVKNPVLSAAALAAAGSAFVGYAQGWMAAFLIRDKGMDLADIAIWYSLVTGLGSMIGTFASGWISDRLGKRYAGAYGLVPMAAHLVSLPLFLLSLWAPGWHASLAFYVIPAMLGNAFLAPMFAVVQNNVSPGQRAMASALLLFALNLIGLGGGPLFVGLVSDFVAPAYGAQSLTVGLAALSPFVLLAAYLQFRVARALIRRGD